MARSNIVLSKSESKKMFNISENKPRCRMRIHTSTCTSSEVHANIKGNQIHTYGYDLKEAINILNKFPYSDKNFCYKCMRNEHRLFKQIS